VAGLEAQVRDLTAAGCEKVYQEHVSSVAERPELAAMLDYVREGDCVLAAKVDRLARSTAHLLEIVERLKAKKVELRILNLGLDTSTATGKMMLTVIGAIAAFEREMMLERQREGIAAAKVQGKYTGRQPTARRKSAQVVELHRAGVRPADIAKRLGMSRASAYRIVAELSDAAD
jgi:DNA invertase Pin-like site-specific DNA recombinase